MPLYFIPLITAALGWIMNWLFIRILVHNIIPGRQKEFARKLATAVASELFDMNMLKEKISDPVKLKELNPVIEKHIDTFLRVKLVEKLPFIATFIGESTLQKLKEGMMEEIESLLPVVISNYTGSLSQDMDLESIVFQKISQLSPETITAILFNGLKKEFNLLMIMGALLGFIAGIIALLLTFI